MSTSVRVAVFSNDPAGLTTFHAFDPESFTVISAINDALVCIDTEGAVMPALATRWRWISPQEVEFELRQGVTFHNGERFDAESVVATFEAHRLPTPSAAIRGLLGVVTRVRRVGDYTVRIETAVPDAMLLRRLFLSSIYPAGLLRERGRDALAAHPVGTGAYRFVRHERGREIVLERNLEHWSGKATIDRLHLPIVRQKEWIDRLARGEVDVALNLDCRDRMRAATMPELQVASRLAANTQWFLFANRGPLADVRVRRAMNHAVNRPLLVEVAQHGFGSPQRSIAAEGEQGHVECEPYRYSPALSRSLLEAAGHGNGIVLHGLVSETSLTTYGLLRELLARVGVELHAEIVPKAEWLDRVVQGNLHGTPYEGDFAMMLVDNPILHSLFHHFIFLHSQGPFSLHRDPGYDARFRAAATVFEETEARAAQAELERYARDEALVLFTVHEHVHVAMRPGFSCTLPRSGHFDTDALTSLRMAADATPGKPFVWLAPADDDDERALLDATSYGDAFFLRDGTHLARGTSRQIWDNLDTSQRRSTLQNQTMVRALVQQAEARTSLNNVLGSTDRMAIVGRSSEGCTLFVNSGYERLFGSGERSVLSWLGAQWADIEQCVTDEGAWLGPVHVPPQGRPAGAPTRLYLSVTRALDDEGVVAGHTFVFSDMSGAEERIRHEAIRTILDHVPYGLLLCDREGRVLDGYSEVCRQFFAGASAIAGRPLAELLGLPPRAASHLACAFGQVFDGMLPLEVSLANLPSRVESRGRTLALSAASVEAGDGVDRLLVTLIDVTAYAATEREVEDLHGVVEVARHRDRFAEFALDLHTSLQRLAILPADALQAPARRELHTAKGVLAQFQLAAAARFVHALEDKCHLTPDDMLATDDMLRSLLQRNEALWNIHLTRDEARHTTTEAALARLEADVRAATSLDEARQIVARGLEALRLRSVAEVMGPLQESCARLAERHGKRVRLEIIGGELSCPARLTRLFDVVPHLLRNSIAHGIESDRQRAGKPDVATIELTVQARGDGLLVKVRDDGQGIDTVRVAERAVQLGAVTETQAATMSHDELCELVFLERLSTATELSETSGRGVGMSAVKHMVESLGGHVSLRDTPGRGTELQLHA